MRYWIEKTYPSRREEGDFTSVLLSPTRANGENQADIYSNMRIVNLNDVVLHLDQDSDSIVGYSYVADKYIEFQWNNRDHYSVNLNNFTPFKIAIDIYKILNDPYNQQILAEKRNTLNNLFYMLRNNKFSLAQGAYLTEIDIHLFNMITSNLNIPTPNNNTITDEESFVEGKDVTRIHKSKERNKKLIKESKRRFKEVNNALFCECCGFNFQDKYGEIGEDFIEAHHTIPVSSLKDDHQSKIEDIVLLCSNCHRMIHRKRPWIEVNNLKELII